MDVYPMFTVTGSRIILKLDHPVYWSYWTQPRVRLFRRELLASRAFYRHMEAYFSKLQARKDHIELYGREESDYAN